jgi:hypothetical protein
MTDAYDDLTKLAAGTPCQLTKLDTRALYRLSEWMKAYCQKRRNGAMPPPGETAAAAYYMVSFFLGLLSASRPFAFDAVNRCFDQVAAYCFINSLATASRIIGPGVISAECSQHAARH